MTAFVFIPLLALTWVIGLILAVFAAHYFLVVIDSTTAGGERIVWPDEPLTDWFAKVFYLAWLGGAWMAPLVIFGRLMTYDPWLRFAITAGSFWLFFPIGMLSSLSANSPWVPLSPKLFGRMAQRAGTVFGFYLLSIPISLAFVGSFHAIVMKTGVSTMITVLLAPVASAGYLIYGRVLGRLGLVLTVTTGGDNEKAKRKGSRKTKDDEPTPLGQHAEQPVVHMQPSELPPVETIEGPLTGYNVQFGDKAPITRSKPKPLPKLHEDADLTPPLPKLHEDGDEDLTPFAVEPELPNPEAATKPPERAPPREDEIVLWDKTKRVKEPEHPWNASLVTFLFEPRTTSAWLILTAGLAIFGLLIGLLRELRPT
jgi:hypothetical protein